MGMKGFYFSLDALTASTVLVALTGFLITVNTFVENPQNNQNIEELYTATKQPYKDWNKSKTYPNQKKVITEIYDRYYSGNKSRAEDLCQNYFDINKYNLYFENQTRTVEACGNINLTKHQSLISTQVPLTDIKINKTFLGPHKAVMVTKN